MFMVTDDLKVAVSTHHIPVAEIAKTFPKKKSRSRSTIGNNFEEDFCVQKPKIAVLGLNPHAGDGGVIGKEEIEIIEPAIKEFLKGALAFGPYPADSFFQPEKYKAFDAVLAMYHDQGLAPFKTIAYEEGVNYTAGLPFIRTSPDHGVAYDIAGKNLADETSFSEAIFTAIKIFKNRTEYRELMENQLRPKAMHINNGVDEDLPTEAE
jgi:4-hydroxythreonine-4-phosphate dehydrogenase